MGAKKKCVNGLVRSESTNIGGTKKKVIITHGVVFRNLFVSDFRCVLK